MSSEFRRGYHSKRSDVERLAIVSMLFVLLVLMGTGIGIRSFLYPRSQSSTSPSMDISANQPRSTVADLVIDIRQQLESSPDTRSLEKTDSSDTESVSNVPATNSLGLESQFLNRSGDNPPAGQPNTTKNLGEPDLEATAPSPIEGRTLVPPHTAAAKSPKARPCQEDTCRQAYAACIQLCDAAMSMAVAACPRVSSGASPQDEKTCLAKRDRSRRYCHSGCEFRITRSHALKAK